MGWLYLAIEALHVSPLLSRDTVTAHTLKDDVTVHARLTALTDPATVPPLITHLAQMTPASLLARSSG